MSARRADLRHGISERDEENGERGGVGERGEGARRGFGERGVEVWVRGGGRGDGDLGGGRGGLRVGGGGLAARGEGGATAGGVVRVRAAEGGRGVQRDGEGGEEGQRHFWGGGGGVVWKIGGRVIGGVMERYIVSGAI